MKGFLPDQTRISQVHLRTARLERAVEFYSSVLGLKASTGPDAQAMLSAMPKKPALLVLSEDRNASPHMPQTIGLYHFALRYGTRNDLAQAYRRIVKAGYPVNGASDHGVSEAIYLGDPDGTGVELYVDRPRSQWRWQNGQIAMVTTPLDLDNFLATIPSKTARTDSPPQIDLGHIHLHVANLTAAERFYSEFLGLGVTQRSYPGALFFAAGSYHHHIGANVWAGQGVPPVNSVGLVSYRLEVPVSEILYCLSHRAPLLGYEAEMQLKEQGNRILQVRDPNGHLVEVQASENAAKARPGSLWAGCPEKGKRVTHLHRKRSNNRMKIEL
ncbi:MAG TPA: VOC family protein [Candidatus Acidoferrum sp.]|nr:VOC family protein [Candidatus Acidoferrum sp.]